MRFCLITTFFGANSFGGDAVFVEHLSRALLRRGHEVDVIHSDDAFNAVRAGREGRRFTPIPGLRVHALRTGAPLLSALWIQQTSSLGPLRNRIQSILSDGGFDVVHYHNVSLIGGAEALRLLPARGRPVKLMTVHDHWLLCPLSSLWKFDREVCETPECFRCTIHRGRPPQLWRNSGKLNRTLGGIDAFFFPSPHALELNRRRGRDLGEGRLELLPYFLPEDWADPAPAAPATRAARPYFIAVGRLVPEKGFQQIIPLMTRFPGADLVIVGAGRSEGDLRRLAAGMSNVHFTGIRSLSELKPLYREAVAAIIPSLFLETFCYVAGEAMSAGIPLIVRDLGALSQFSQAGAALAFRTGEELFAAMSRLMEDPALREALAAKGRSFCCTVMSEDAHFARYFAVIRELQSQN